MEHLRRLVQDLAVAGYQLDRSAYEYLTAMREAQATTFAKSLLIRIEEKKPRDRILTKTELLEIALPETAAPLEIAPSVAPTIPAKKISARANITRDPAKEIGGGGSIEDFSHYFRDRFQKLGAAFRERQDARDASTIDVALKAAQNGKVKIVAMVMEKRERQRRIFLQIDDLDDSATVLVSPEEHGAYEVAQKVPLDQVVCVAGVRARGELIVAKEI